MNVLVEEPLEGIRLDLHLARLGLLEARRAQAHRDSPATRRAVQECLDRLDIVLDVWLYAAHAQHA